MNHAQRQRWYPALVLAVSVAGGYLLNYYFSRSQPKSPIRADAVDIPIRLSSARLGAREEQIDHTMQQPSEKALQAGEPGPTGAAYDLDPNSITPG
jgi:hypothetical protein